MARGRTVAQLLQAELGTGLFDRDTEAQAGVAAAQMLRNNPNRLAFIYMNLSVGDTHRIRAGKNPTATAGLTVGPGEWRSFWYREDGMLPTREWFVLSSGAASAYFIQEILSTRSEGTE